MSHPDHIIRYCGLLTIAGRLSKLPSNAKDVAHTTSTVASGDVKERAMKQYIFAGLGAALVAGALIDSAPPASAGCQYGGIVVSKFDGPALA
jgi:hypothetical protein